MLCELADIYGAIEGFLENHGPATGGFVTTATAQRGCSSDG